MEGSPYKTCGFLIIGTLGRAATKKTERRTLWVSAFRDQKPNLAGKHQVKHCGFLHSDQNRAKNKKTTRINTVGFAKNMGNAACPKKQSGTKWHPVGFNWQ